jgi:hypothetical protein
MRRYLKEVAAPVQKTEINHREGSATLTTRYPSIRKSWPEISPTSGGRSVGIVRLLTKGHGVCFCFIDAWLKDDSLWNLKILQQWLWSVLPTGLQLCVFLCSVGEDGGMSQTKWNPEADNKIYSSLVWAWHRSRAVISVFDAVCRSMLWISTIVAFH